MVFSPLLSDQNSEEMTDTARVPFLFQWRRILLSRFSDMVSAFNGGKTGEARNYLEISRSGQDYDLFTADYFLGDLTWQDCLDACSDCLGLQAMFL
jgi:hypothetical protein